MQLRQYAEVSGDFDPIHVDEVFARRVGLNGVVAHNMLVMDQVGAMLTDWIDNEGLLVNFEVRFQKMVSPGELITCSGYIKAIYANNLLCEVLAINSCNQKVLSGSATVTFRDK